MNKDDKIYIRLEICKDKNSDELTIMTHFDSNAPNFSKDKDGYFWMPTLEERNFINEAFELIPTNNIKSLSPEKPTGKPLEEGKLTAPKPQINIEDKKPEKMQSPFESKVGEKPTDLPPLKKREEEVVFEKTEEESKSNDLESEIKKEDEDKEILVEADEQAIDVALKKDEEKDKSIVEADEQTIIEKVLSQKKKGKWSKGR